MVRTLQFDLSSNSLASFRRVFAPVSPRRLKHWSSDRCMISYWLENLLYFMLDAKIADFSIKHKSWFNCKFILNYLLNTFIWHPALWWAAMPIRQRSLYRRCSYQIILTAKYGNDPSSLTWRTIPSTLLLSCDGSISGHPLPPIPLQFAFWPIFLDLFFNSSCVVFLFFFTCVLYIYSVPLASNFICSPTYFAGVCVRHRSCFCTFLSEDTGRAKRDRSFCV